MKDICILKLTRVEHQDFPIILTLCDNQCHLNNMQEIFGDHLPSIVFQIW